MGEAFSYHDYLRSRWIHAYALLRLAEALELHHAGDQREECVIASNADVVSGMHLGTPLTDENAASGN